MVVKIVDDWSVLPLVETCKNKLEKVWDGYIRARQKMSVQLFCQLLVWDSQISRIKSQYHKYIDINLQEQWQFNENESHKMKRLKL